MNPSDVFDLKRMFLGDAPPLFLVEIAVRSAFMYGYALLMLRLMGRRSMGQLSPFDFAIVIALGSAVGDPMFYPEVPLLHGAVVITVIVAFEHGLAALVQRSDKADMVISGTPVLLVEDGRLTPDSHGEDALSREELFGIFRREKIRQLGEIQRAYLEQSGHVSVFAFKGDAARPGLPIVPPWDIEHPETFAAGATVPESGAYACSRCGATVDYRRGDPFNLCPACQNDEWTRATLAPLAS